MNTSDDDALDIFDPEAQRHLRLARAVILAGRFKNKPSAIPNAVLARKLVTFREDIDADVDLLCVAPEYLIVLVTPKDGGDLVVMRLDALELIDTDCPPQ